MGQRTQIFLQTVDRKGHKTLKCYHMHWGTGDIMPLAIMHLVLHDMFFGEVKSVHDYSLETKSITDITRYYEDKDYVDIDDVDEVAGLFEGFDNNNGGMVIQITEGFGEPDKVRVGFMLGPEDSEQPFTEYVPFPEFAREVGGEFISGEDIEMFQTFFKHFKIEVMN